MCTWIFLLLRLVKRSSKEWMPVVSMFVTAAHFNYHIPIYIFDQTLVGRWKKKDAYNYVISCTPYSMYYFLIKKKTQ